MPCYHPLQAFRVPGEKSLMFCPHSAEKAGAIPINIPCGSCIGCRLERSRQWASRMVDEASMYSKNCFVTLTFRDEDLPDDYSVRVSDMQLFVKRLRRKFGSGIRVFYCGEYGERFGRPHYHAIIFNHDFDDKVYWKTVEREKLFLSDSLAVLWPYGFTTVGSVSFKSAAYVARYCIKKVNGKQAEDYYKFPHPVTGEIIQRFPEFAKMSLKPGIGEPWFEKFWKDIYPSDEKIVNGAKMKPPRYYDKLYERMDPEGFQRVKVVRIEKAYDKADDNTEKRLAVKEKCQLLRMQRLVRAIEMESII